MRRILRILFVPLWLGAGGLLIWLSLQHLDLARLWQTLREVMLGPLLLALAVDLVSVFCKASKWHFLLRPVERVGILRLQGSIYAGGATSLIMPFRLDEAVRAYSAARLSNLTFMQVIGSMVLERLVDVCVLLSFFLLLMGILPLPSWIFNTLLWLGLLAVGLLSVLVVVHLMSRSGRTFGLLGSLLNKMAEGSRAIAQPRLLALAAVFAICEWVLTVSVSGLAAWSLGLTMPMGALLLVTALLFGSFAIPLTPAGIGTFEVGMGLLLPLFYKVTKQQAVPLALIIHTLLLSPMLVVGSTIIAISGIRLADVDRWRSEQ